MRRDDGNGCSGGEVGWGRKMIGLCDRFYMIRGGREEGCDRSEVNSILSTRCTHPHCLDPRIILTRSHTFAIAAEATRQPTPPSCRNRNTRRTSPTRPR